MGKNAETSRRYYRKHKDKWRAYARAYYRKNKAKAIARTKKWNESNPDKVRASQLKWSKSPSGQAYYKRTAKKRAAQQALIRAVNIREYLERGRANARLEKWRSYAKAWRNNNRDKVRRWNKEWRARNQHKTVAFSSVLQAVRLGVLSKKPCEKCGTTKDVRASHNDYDVPMDINWLCRIHAAERTMRKKSMWYAEVSK